ncbi:lipase [Psychrosphaera sp. 1_MG-2023]|uniref:VolA/Pla-1 family phospholipase n=1 Tax=Psychrosphaera sp. 1_MG-2023 TaxID=3062643 RepID=UPI0026E46BF0|nr:VolA/Pla-1 family phospholipase [Psychrosphaera sp. 1_MG-2023]MDO6718060.1 lipase [Psychrosphaera sp. 1_MG-2023]
MKKLAISIAVTSILGLTACDDTTLENIQKDSASLVEANEPQPKVSVVFDPSNGKLSVPNDLLYSGTQDFTLEMPEEVASKAAGESVNWASPASALGALDGWGTQNPFTIELAYDSGVTLDATSIMSGDAVALYEVVKFPELSDPDCADASRAGLICKGTARLTFGVDYVTTLSGGNIAVVPLKPLKAGKSYAVALTKEIKDSNGNPLNPSSTYASVEQDINTLPIVHPDLTASELNETQAGIRLLQTMFNNFENTLADTFGANKDAIVYTQVFTVQSAGVPGTDPLQITKLLNAQKFAGMAAADPSSVATLMLSQGFNVAQAFAQAGAIENDPDSLPYKLYSSADVYGAQISMPYYLENAETGSPLTGRWEAACDSGVMLQSLTQDQLVALSANTGDNHELCSSAQIGLADFGIDTQRHLTKYNPVPKVKSMETVDVQITLPNLDNANSIRAEQGLTPLAGRPDAGWPVVILQHGITSKKEDMLAATGFLSMFGFATVAIDHPLHGSRGFTDDGVVINASTENPTHYLNLQSLLTARDNGRQSVADALRLRLSLNAMADVTAYSQDGVTPPDAGVIDSTRVYYMGHSLGAITGTAFTAVANTPANTGDAATDAAINAAYKINASFLANGGGSLVNFLLESASFSPLVKASVIYGLGNELSQSMALNLQPANYGLIVAQEPSCGAALNENFEVVDQNIALVCAYNAFVASASDAEKAGMASAFAQFSFAAQAIVEATDPTNYAGLLAATQTPVLMIEMVGDIDRGGDNPSDLVVPNFVATNPMAGTSGLATSIGLQSITESMMDSSGSVSGIVRLTAGSHSTILSPATSLGGNYPTLYALLNQDLNLMMNYYFLSDGASVQIGDNTLGACLVKGGNPETCSQ